MTDRAKRRRCRACGAVLATDNQSDLCSPCARTATHGRAPTLPADFWERPEIRKAVQARNFGALLRAYRQGQQPAIKQSEVAAWIGITQAQVSRIELGITPVRDLAKLDRWARVLGIPQRCLWISLSPDSPNAYPTHAVVPSLPSILSPEGDDVHRRQVFKAAGVGVLAVGASLLRQSIAQPAAKSSSQRVAGGPDVELVREVTAAFRRVDNKYGGGHSRTALNTYLGTNVEPMLKDGRVRGTARNELFTATAELHQLAGWMAYDTGHAADGRAHLRTALRLCQETGDYALSAEMLAGMSHHAAFRGAAESAVDLALAARQTAKQAGLPALASEAAVMEAHGLALQREKRGCLSALQEAEAAYARIDRGELPLWLSYFDEAYLSAKFAHTFRDLGRPQDAEPFARRSLEMSEGYERGRLFNTALLASILADIGKIDEACLRGADAVQMTDTIRSMRGTAYLADLAQRLVPHRSNVAVQALFEQMVEIGISVPSSS